MKVSQKLKGKNILFCSPAFFNYEKEIVNKMRTLGATVDYYDERSINKPIDRALLKINPSFFNVRTNKYYNNIINDNLKKDYDYILIVRADMITVRILQKLKACFPKAKLNLYLWDSLKNVVGIKSKLKYFDKIFSFDRVDVEHHKELIFRPLFFSDKYIGKKNKQNLNKFRYKLCFIGTIHSDRYGLIKKISNQILTTDNDLFTYMFLQSDWIYFIHKLFKKDFKHSKRDEFKTKPLSIDNVSRIESESEIILDIQHPKQSGLTMRTIEMLGMQKKIITTNKEVMKYDFFNPNNICVVDRNNPSVDNKFLKINYVSTPENIYNNYSLETWLDEVLR